MPSVEARYFTLANGNEPPGCQVDSNTKVIGEILILSDFGTLNEEITLVEINVARSDNGQHIKCFRWTGDCALRAGVFYTINTPQFILPALPAGANYTILTGFSSMPLSRPLPECGINLAEVTC